MSLARAAEAHVAARRELGCGIIRKNAFLLATPPHPPLFFNKRSTPPAPQAVQLFSRVLPQRLDGSAVRHRHQAVAAGLEASHRWRHGQGPGLQRRNPRRMVRDGWFLRRAARPLRCSNRLFPTLFLLWSLPVLRYLISIDGLDVSDRAPSTLQPLLLGAAGCSPPSSSTAIF